MPEEQLKAFLEAVKVNAALQEQLKSVKNAEEVVEIAKNAGFLINVYELTNQAFSNNELSDEELESVAGGTMCTADTNGCKGVTIVFSIITVLDSGC